MRKLLSPEVFGILFLAVITATAYQAEPEPVKSNATLIEVVDGDTIDVESGGQEITIRLLGVDAPETNSANTPQEFGLRDTFSNRRCLESYGERAAEFLEQKLDSQIKYRTDSSADRRGEYGRLLAYVYEDNSSVNRLLVEKGLARVYTGKFSREGIYLRQEKQAKRKEKGLWSC
ncbi:nuclease [Candidatus Nanohaloarchaea archaeon]|nr:nuclease [Candidatus Nanohaloarchaea archaeon]